MSEQAPQSQKTSPNAALERRVLLARAALLWEQTWPRLGPAIYLIGTVAALGLFDIPYWISPWLHAAVLAGFALALLAALVWARRTFVWPGRAAGLRRLELKSGTSHRPLLALEDRMAGTSGDAATQALWQVHQTRLRAAIKRLKIGVPAGGFGRTDRYAIRAGLAAILVVGLVVAGADAPRRLGNALMPDFEGRNQANITLDAWIAPPGYTGLPPIFLSRDGHARPVAEGVPALAIPTGSVLTARVHGGRRAPVLRLDKQDLPFVTADGENHQFSKQITEGASLAIRQFDRPLGAWPIRIVPDHPPTAHFPEPPKSTARAALQINYAAEDDYGLKKVTAQISREGSTETIKIELPLAGGYSKKVQDINFQDLSAHTWAGLPVTIQLVAEDAIGQTGLSDAVELVLPERDFSHPVARALIEQRRKLTTDPDKRRAVAAALNGINLLPEAYGEDTVVQLALRTAAVRLTRDTNGSSVVPVQDLLWDTALRLEEGNLTDAERALRQAQKELQDALARNASDEEIERLMQKLQQAMNQFMQAMAQQALERMKRGEKPEPMGPNDRVLSQQDLQKMLDRARELARSGARDAARNLLSQLQQMMEGLKQGRLMQQQPGQGQGQGQGQAMQELSDLMQKQQELMDRSFRQGQQGQQGQRGQGGQPGGMAGEQEALRQQLGELMRRLGEAGGNLPDAFGRADQAMRDARGALQNDQPGQAVPSQSDALDQLRQGAQSMLQQMQNQMNANGGPEGRDPGRADPSREDPLGRPMLGSNQDDGNSTKVPSQFDMQRAREILEELYRRSGERQRPQGERDYIERLLKQF